MELLSEQVKILNFNGLDQKEFDFIKLTMILACSGSSRTERKNANFNLSQVEILNLYSGMRSRAS